MAYNGKATPYELVVILPTVNFGTGATWSIFNPSFAGEIVGVALSNTVTLNRDANSYTTLTLIDNTTPTHTLATLTNSTAAGATTFTANTMISGVLAATNTNKRFALGDAIQLIKTDTGAGNTLTTATLWVEYIAGTYDS